MTFWHGTTIENAEKIRQEGLRPQPDKKYDIVIPGAGTLKDREGEEVRDFVYLTELEDRAKFYALFRVEYEQAPVGALIREKAFKIGGEIKSAARPAVIRFELPETLAESLKSDRQDSNFAYTYRGVIPPEFIKEVIAL